VKFTEAAALEQEKRYVDLVAASRVVTLEVAERTRQMQTLSEDLGRSAKMKDEMLVELDRVHSRQRDAVNQVQATEDQLVRAESMYKQLEVRRSQMAFGERKVAA